MAYHAYSKVKGRRDDWFRKRSAPLLDSSATNVRFRPIFPVTNGMDVGFDVSVISKRLPSGVSSIWRRRLGCSSVPQVTGPDWAVPRACTVPRVRRIFAMLSRRSNVQCFIRSGITIDSFSWPMTPSILSISVVDVFTRNRPCKSVAAPEIRQSPLTENATIEASEFKCHSSANPFARTIFPSCACPSVAIGVNVSGRLSTIHVAGAKTNRPTKYVMMPRAPEIMMKCRVSHDAV